MSAELTKDYMTIDQAAAALGISDRAVSSLVRRGYLTATKIFGRTAIEKSAVAARKRAKKEGKLPKPGRKPKPDSEIKIPRDSSQKAR